ncbi:hypothetical protein SBF1_50090 [Candidatus Desulfosporosinus infrequens]|uniref:Uncharacterized protein n=1 Tax=Candidatus Desulfosporosinus infrequens TaxID=2043169 RepID=A0A2U3LHB2_9FIRM|nr:hypothetical protein SBF1_50090 [Candidatus Desulfosporosinus infrequens]
MRIERGPACKECQCAVCGNLPKCHVLAPTTEYYCEKECGGMVGVGNCQFANRKNEESEAKTCSEKP